MTSIRDTIVLRLRAGSDASNVIAACGGEDSGRRIAPLRAAMAWVPEGADPDALLAAFRSHPDVESASFDVQGQPRVAYHAAKGNDPFPEYHLKRMSVYRAWQILGNKGSPSVKCGVVDSGIVTHADLPDPYGAGYIGYNTTTDTADPYDTTCDYLSYGLHLSHGSRITGFLHAKNNNAEGVTGIAPGCTPVTVATGNAFEVGPWGMFDLAEGLIWATDHGARIVNMSWGGSLGPEPTGEALLADAIAYVWSHGGIAFGAAGNYGENLDAYDHWPNNSPHVFNVSGIGSTDARAVFFGQGAATGSIVHACAPSEGGPTSVYWSTDIASQPPVEPYYYRNGFGTSFGTPLTLGVAALALSAYSGLTNQQLWDVLVGSLDRSLDPNFYTYFPNAGIINAAKAVLRAKSVDPANAGQVFPYAGFWRARPDGGYTTGGPWDLITSDAGTGLARTTLAGSVVIDLAGYSSNPITGVELWFNGSKLYDGAPGQINATASYDGMNTYPVKIVAKTATASGEETYDSDVFATTLVLIEDAHLVGVASGQASGTSTPATSRPLAGTASGQAAASGAPTQLRPISGTASGQAGGSATPTVKQPLGGTASGTGAGQGGAPSVSLPLAAAAGGQAGASGNLTSTGGDQGASSSGSGGGLGTLSVVTPTPSALRGVNLQAADGSVRQIAIPSIRLTAADGSSYALAVAPTGFYGTSPTVGLAGVAAGGAGAVAIGPQVSQPLGGAAAGQGGGSLGAPGVSQGLGGTAGGQGGAQAGTPTGGQRALDGTAAGHAGASATLAYEVPLTGTASGQAGAAVGPSPSELAGSIVRARAVWPGVEADRHTAGLQASRVTPGLRCGMKDGKVYQGDDTDIDFPVARYVDGSPIDLTGATLYCEVQFGTDTPIVAGATFINADGTSRARFSSSQTALWVKDKQGKFDGRVKLANGLKHTVGTGEFWVKDPITTVP